MVSDLSDKSGSPASQSGEPEILPELLAPYRPTPPSLEAPKPLTTSTPSPAESPIAKYPKYHPGAITEYKSGPKDIDRSELRMAQDNAQVEFPGNDQKSLELRAIDTQYYLRRTISNRNDPNGLVPDITLPEKEKLAAANAERYFKHFQGNTEDKTALQDIERRVILRFMLGEDPGYASAPRMDPKDLPAISKSEHDRLNAYYSKQHEYEVIAKQKADQDFSSLEFNEPASKAHSIDLQREIFLQGGAAAPLTREENGILAGAWAEKRFPSKNDGSNPNNKSARELFSQQELHRLDNTAPDLSSRDKSLLGQYEKNIPASAPREIASDTSVLKMRIENSQNALYKFRDRVKQGNAVLTSEDVTTFETAITEADKVGDAFDKVASKMILLNAVADASNKEDYMPEAKQTWSELKKLNPVAVYNNDPILGS